MKKKIEDGQKVLGAKQILHFELEDVVDAAKERYEGGRSVHGDYWMAFDPDSHIDGIKKEIDRIPNELRDGESIEDYDEYFADALNRLLFTRAVLSDDYTVGEIED